MYLVAHVIPTNGVYINPESQRKSRYTEPLLAEAARAHRYLTARGEVFRVNLDHDHNQLAGNIVDIRVGRFGLWGLLELFVAGKEAFDAGYQHVSAETLEDYHRYPLIITGAALTSNPYFAGKHPSVPLERKGWFARRFSDIEYKMMRRARR